MAGGGKGGWGTERDDVEALDHPPEPHTPKATCGEAMPPTARERATLERVRDDLGLAAGLGDEATLAAARASLQLAPAGEAGDDGGGGWAAQLAEVCAELGFAPHEVVAEQEVVVKEEEEEEGVPPVAMSTPAPAPSSPAPPPCYADALGRLEDPRQLYCSAQPAPARRTAPAWREQLRAQLSVRNGLQGERVAGLLQQVNAVTAAGQSQRERSAAWASENEVLRREKDAMETRLRELETHGASSAERDELVQKVSELQAKLISSYEEREQAAQQRQQLAEVRSF